MAKIPRASNRLLPRGGDPRNISAAAAPGEGVASLGADVQNITNQHLLKQKKLRQSRQLSEGRADFANILRSEEDAIKRTDQHSVWANNFEETATKRVDDYIKININDEEVATALKNYSTLQVAGTKNRLITEATNTEIDVSKASLTSTVRKNIDLAISDRRNSKTYLQANAEAIDEAVNQRIISATMGEKIKNAAKSQTVDGQVDNDILSNPWRALKGLKGKTYDIGERRRTYWKKIARNEIRRREAEATKAAAEFQGIELVKTALRAGVALDWKNTEHKKAVENYYNKVLIPEISKAGSDEAKNRIVSFSSSIGMVPFSVQSNLRSQMINPNPQVAANAADIVSRLQITNSQLLTTMSKGDIAFSKMVSEWTKAGASPEQAVTDARRIIGISDAEKATLNATYRGEQYSESNVSHLKDTDFVDPSIFTSAADVPARLVTDYNTSVKKNYLLTGGNIAMARSLSDQEIKNKWGITNIGGRRMMRLAPEVVYKRLDPDTSWIEKQYDGMAKRGVEGLDQSTKDKWKLILGRDLEVSDITLQSDAITGREPVPGYSMVFPDGSFLMNGSGGILRYYPDYKNTEQFVIRTNEMKLELEQRAFEQKRSEFLQSRSPVFRKVRKLSKGLIGESKTQFIENYVLGEKFGASPIAKHQFDMGQVSPGLFEDDD